MSINKINVIAEDSEGVEYLLQLAENVWVTDIIAHSEYLIRALYGRDVEVHDVRRGRYI